MNRSATFELTLSRFIRAPRERVFDAFVSEKGIRSWMCPRGMGIPVASVDPRVGGSFRLTMRARNGESFTAGGIYREIERPERLVYTWAWEGEGMPNMETLISVSFSERDGGTEVQMTHSGFPDAALCDSHRQGWSSSLNKLVDTLDPRGSAATVTLLGSPPSTYTWTARMGLAEKGVKYTMQEVRPHTPETLEVHPFGRVPALRDGDTELFETSAILRYVDESFDGPHLLPQNIRDRARAEQWVSAINSYLYDLMIRRYVLQYLFPKGMDGKPDRAVIDAAVKEIRERLPILEKGYGERAFLAGADPTLPDYFLSPILTYVERMAEGKSLLEPFPRVRAALKAMQERPSFRESAPPQKG